MNHAQWRQYFYQSLTSEYIQSELMELYHWVMEEVYGWNRSQLYFHNQEPVSEDKREKLESIIKRLKIHEPVQHIFQKAYFMDLVLTVNEHVLIPRPETEELVELLLSDFSVEENLNVLDIGTGSGCIPLAIKRYKPAWCVKGVDISNDALTIAKKNALMLDLDVTFDSFDALGDAVLPACEVVISNPPYIPNAVKPTIERNVLAFEPHLALFVSDDDPFVFYKAITRKANTAGVEGVYFETHATDMEQMLSELRPLWNGSLEIRNDLAGKPRFIVGRK